MLVKTIFRFQSTSRGNPTLTEIYRISGPTCMTFLLKTIPCLPKRAIWTRGNNANQHWTEGEDSFRLYDEDGERVLMTRW